MSVLPFSDFLELLRAKGLGVSLHEHIAVGKLLERWDATDRERFRDAVAALVARNDDEARVVRILFDQFYPRETRPSEPTAGTIAAPPRRYRGIQLLRSRAALIATVALAAGAFAIALALRYYATPGLPPPPPSPVLYADVVLPAPPPPDAPSPETALAMYEAPMPVSPAAELPPPPSTLNRPLLAALVASVLVIALLAAWGTRLWSSAQRWTEEAWRRTVAALPGPYHPRLVLRDLVTRLPRRDVEDAATLLARAFSGLSGGREMDVQRTLQRTLSSGLRPHLVFRPRRVQQTVLVLQDVSQLMDSHTPRVDSFLTDLRRQGVVLERWYFDGDISVVSGRKGGPPLPLASLAKRREDWPLMVMSSGFGLPATLTKRDRSWLQAFRLWTRRVWLSPISDTGLWPSDLQEVPIEVLPMSRNGLLRAAAILAQGEYAAAIRGTAAVSVPVTAADVLTLKRLASVVPFPTIPELELLRQRFAPAVPESAVLHAAGSIESHAGGTLRMPDGEIRDHLRQLRKDLPGLEAEVRGYLLRLLDQSEPAAGSAAHLRWEISTAVHRAEIARLTSSDAGPALAALSELSNGPLWQETRDAVARLPESEQASAGRKAAGVRIGAGPPVFRTADASVRVPAFRPPGLRLRDALAAAGAAALVAALASSTTMFRVQASHALDAYQLEYMPAEPAGTGVFLISARGDASVPHQVRLYRDGTPMDAPIAVPEVGEIAVPVSSDGRAHAFQVRADLESGALAVSNTVWAPSRLIVIDAQPWARVTVRSRVAGIPPLTQTTPAAMRLPEGTYDVTLENGNVTAPLTTTINVRSTGEGTFTFQMPGFDPAAILDDLVGPPSPVMRQ